MSSLGNLRDPNRATLIAVDRIEFHFFSGSGGHSVVSSTFESPCVAETGAFFSGYIPGNDQGVCFALLLLLLWFIDED